MSAEVTLSLACIFYFPALYIFIVCLFLIELIIFPPPVCAAKYLLFQQIKMALCVWDVQATNLPFHNACRVNECS